MYSTALKAGGRLSPAHTDSRWLLLLAMSSSERTAFVPLRSLRPVSAYNRLSAVSQSLLSWKWSAVPLAHVAPTAEPMAFRAHGTAVR